MCVGLALSEAKAVKNPSSSKDEISMHDASSHSARSLNLRLKLKVAASRERNIQGSKMNLIGNRRLGVCETKRTSLSVCRAALHGNVASHTEQTTSSAVYRSPLLDAVKERGDRSQEISLHVPGHKVGATSDQIHIRYAHTCHMHKHSTGVRLQTDSATLGNDEARTLFTVPLLCIPTYLCWAPSPYQCNAVCSRPHRLRRWRGASCAPSPVRIIYLTLSLLAEGPRYQREDGIAHRTHSPQV